MSFVIVAALLWAGESAASEPTTGELRPEAPPRGTPGGALALSLACTVVPVAVGIPMCKTDKTSTAGGILIGAGIILGPSAGYAYAGATRRAGVDILTHVALGAGLVVGVAVGLNHDVPVAGAVALMSAFLLTAHAIHDQFEMPRLYCAVRDVSVAPAVMPDGAIGGRIDLRF